EKLWIRTDASAEVQARTCGSTRSAPQRTARGTLSRHHHLAIRITCPSEEHKTCPVYAAPRTPGQRGIGRFPGRQSYLPFPSVRPGGLRPPGRVRPRAGAPTRAVRAVGGARRTEIR